MPLPRANVRRLLFGCGREAALGLGFVVVGTLAFMRFIWVHSAPTA